MTHCQRQSRPPGRMPQPCKQRWQAAVPARRTDDGAEADEPSISAPRTEQVPDQRAGYRSVAMRWPVPGHSCRRENRGPTDGLVRLNYEGRACGSGADLSEPVDRAGRRAAAAGRDGRAAAPRGGRGRIFHMLYHCTWVLQNTAVFMYYRYRTTSTDVQNTVALKGKLLSGWQETQCSTLGRNILVK